MHIDELRARFGLSRSRIYQYIADNIIDPPVPRTGRAARYPVEAVERIAAYQALLHSNVNPKEAVAFCKEEGITLREFVKRREDAIRTFGLGVA